MSRFSRRTLLTAPFAVGAGLAQRSQNAGSERRRFADGTTENEVFRLTDPAYANWLPSASGRCIAKNNTLLYCSDRSGRVQVHRMDLKSGESRQLTDGAEVAPESAVWLPDEKSFLFVDGKTLKRSDGSRDRDLYQSPNAIEPGIAVTEDGLSGFVTERVGDRWRIVQVPLLVKAQARTLVESDQPLTSLRPRPKRASLLYVRGGTLNLVTFDGKASVVKSEGQVRQAEWMPDGRTVTYLSRSVEERPQATLREVEPDANADRLFAKTSQFGQFARNADGSVFVGLSASVASPLVLLLLRVTKREFPLCEHRGKNGPTAPPVFTPNSQRIVFPGDRDGKPALYLLALEKLVEKTEESENR